VLLSDMGQFVREQSEPRRRCQGELAFGKNHVASDRVGRRVHRPCRLGRSAVRMDSDLPKIVTEPRPEEVSCRVVQRLARRTQDLLDNPRSPVVHRRLNAHLGKRES
jgi:hypothetical protein